MNTRIYVDGRITLPEKAVLPVLDHGFLFGDSVYEVFWWHRGTLIQADEHLARLEESARRLYMDLQLTRAELLAAIQETCDAAGATLEDDAYVRLIVTRGSGPLGLGFADVPKRTLIIVVAPANRPEEARFERGLQAACVARRRTSRKALDPGAKTGNYLNNVLALHEAKLAGADEAIMLNAKGDVTEATTANVYAVRDGRVTTPPLEAGLLKGTTRTRILALCEREGLPAGEGTLRQEDLKAADEIFISSSVRGVLGIVSIDGTSVGTGAVGPVTRRVRALFEAEAAAESGA